MTLAVVSNIFVLIDNPNSLQSLHVQFSGVLEIPEEWVLVETSLLTELRNSFFTLRSIDSSSSDDGRSLFLTQLLVVFLRSVHLTHFQGEEDVLVRRSDMETRQFGEAENLER